MPQPLGHLRVSTTRWKAHLQREYVSPQRGRKDSQCVLQSSLKQQAEFFLPR